jgi:hypothetical protein
VKPAVITLSVLLLSGELHSWGSTGHQTVAKIGEERLNSLAKVRANELLNKQSFASVSTWADTVRRRRPYTAGWHYVNIPRDETNFDRTRDCVKGNCIVAALERQVKDLGDYSLTKTKRQEALKFIIHFVGDIHQPFHAVDDDDRGGNLVPVMFFDRKSNLHAVWDTDILQWAIANKELQLKPKDDRGKTDFEDWANESHDLAVKAYVEPNRSLRTRYSRKNIRVIEDRIEAAGIRLADIVNQVLGK